MADEYNQECRLESADVMPVFPAESRHHLFIRNLLLTLT